MLLEPDDLVLYAGGVRTRAPSSRRVPGRQIVAMGGGGFSMEQGNQSLDRYILGLTKKRSPRVAFLGTASGDSPDYVGRFYKAMKTLPCRPTDISLFRIPADGPSLAARILGQDVIYVGGGNTANMLGIWRAHRVDRLMRKAWKKGTILCGLSAGMICWFESSVTDSFGPLRELKDGLGLLPGSACPHYDGEARRRPTFQRLVRNGTLPAGYAADDCAAIHFVGRRVFRCIASRPKAKVYRVECLRGRVVESALPVVVLNLKASYKPN
jgi:dipeptidase E